MRAVFLFKSAFFLTIYGHQSSNFFMKNGEKGYPFDQRKINKRMNRIDEFNKNSNTILIFKDIQRKK